MEDRARTLRQGKRRIPRCNLKRRAPYSDQMNMSWLAPHNEAIGLSAGLFTTVAFAPQLIRTWRTGGKDLSWSMLLLFGFGVGLWLVYGLLRTSVPIILTNAATGLQVLMIIALKLRRAGKIA